MASPVDAVGAGHRLIRVYLVALAAPEKAVVVPVARTSLQTPGLRVETELLNRDLVVQPIPRLEVA